MQLFNSGARKIVTANQTIEPKTLFEVDSKEGKKLMELYAGEVVEPPVTAAVKDISKELDAIKAERDEASKKIDKLEAQIEKLKNK